jgi:predicted transcriptional regulator
MSGIVASSVSKRFLALELMKPRGAVDVNRLITIEAAVGV